MDEAYKFNFKYHFKNYIRFPERLCKAKVIIDSEINKISIWNEKIEILLIGVGIKSNK